MCGDGAVGGGGREAHVGVHASARVPRVSEVFELRRENVRDDAEEEAVEVGAARAVGELDEGGVEETRDVVREALVAGEAAVPEV